MEGIVQLTLQALSSFAIYAAVVVAYSLLGAYKNINIWQTKWDWKTWINGLAKYGILGLAVLTVLLSSYAIIAIAPSWGVELQNAEQVAPRVIFGILAAGIIGMLIKCIGKIAEITGTSKDMIEAIKKSAIDNPNGPIILDVADLPGGVSSLPAEYLVDHALIQKTVNEYLGEVGGRGAIVDISSWAAFRHDVLGNAYDIDGYYGAQCWDGAALFWLNAVGRSFSTGGTGAARGGWEAARTINAGSEFELITDRNAIQPGDWLIFGGTKLGHAGMATSGNLGGYVKLLGQNQGGDGNGLAFNEINMNLSSFIGAFRLKRWYGSPAPVKTPTLSSIANNRKPVDASVVAAVIKGEYGNGADRKINLANAGYDPNEVQSAVNAKIKNEPIPASTPGNNVIEYKYQKGDTFGQVIKDLGLGTVHGLWGAGGDVEYYTAQIRSQGIPGGIPVGKIIKLVRRLN